MTEPEVGPAYLTRLAGGALEARVARAYAHLEHCDLCARYCHVDCRRTIEGTACRTGERAVVSSFGPHHGEEDPLRGWRGPPGPSSSAAAASAASSARTGRSARRA